MFHFHFSFHQGLKYLHTTIMYYLEWAVVTFHFHFSFCHELNYLLMARFTLTFLAHSLYSEVEVHPYSWANILWNCILSHKILYCCVIVKSSHKKGRYWINSVKVNLSLVKKRESIFCYRELSHSLGGWDVERQVRGGRPLWGREGGRAEGGPCLRAFQGGQTLGLSRVGDTGSFGTWQARWTHLRSKTILGWKVKTLLLWTETCIRAWQNKNICYYLKVDLSTVSTAVALCQMFLGCKNSTVQRTGPTKRTKCNRWKDWRTA